MTRFYNTISVKFFNLSLNCRIEVVIQYCDKCQRTKLSGTGYGHLPPCEALIAPLFEVAIDLIGPWNVTICSRVFTFQALTCIDKVTNLAEVICIENKTSVHIIMLFENNWLAQYPCSSCCIHKNGGKVTGVVFPICYMLMELKTLLPQQEIHRLIPYANACINQLVINFGQCCVHIHLTILNKLMI